MADLATKADIARVQADIARFGAATKANIERASLTVTVRLGGLIVVGIGALALLKLG